MLTNFSSILGFNLWHFLISTFGNWLTNYGWAIIVFTIALKLLMSPLDVYQRIQSKKQQKFQTAMQPELQAIQAKYANDKNKLNQETAKVYKKYNFSMGGMCLSMLFTMGLSMIVFITLFSSLRSYGTNKLYDSYAQLDNAYVQTVGEVKAEDLTNEQRNELEIVLEEKYDELSKQNSWLWVKNVWKKDTNESQFVDFKDYAKYKGLKDEAKADAKDRYEFITNSIEGEKSEQNGYYVLIILAVAVSFLTQFLSTRLTMPKGQKLNGMNKVMMGIIPLTMIIFAFSSNVVFTLYMIINSLMTAIITTILTIVMQKKNGGKNDEIVLPKKNVEVVEYSRNYKKN